MTRKLFLLITILFILTCLLTFPLFSGCKVAGLTMEEASDGPGEVSIIGEIKPISPEEVYEIIKNGEDYLILDVRSKEEYDPGHLEGAMLLPVSELEDRLDELPVDKPIIVYCKSGGRSRAAANILVENGFTQVYDMGGINDWTAREYPVIVEE